EDFIESSPYVSYLENVVKEKNGNGNGDGTSGNGDGADAYIGKKIGVYRITKEIGRGGMGAVYLAVRDDREFQQNVAIKLIKRGMDSDQVLRRFRNERQILAALNHPNIARLLDGGTTDDGLPYFVMEYIEGLPITQYCDSNRLTVRERLQLFQQVCAAVYYAHQNLIIHRDIKPSNILVTEDGVPKLLDFGIAKLLNPDLIHETQEPTATAMRMMTPEYASPEQVGGNFVTSATDQYSLGVLLYEIVTGHRPYLLENRSPLEIAKVICDKPPATPSAIVGSGDQLVNSNKFSLEPVTVETIFRNRRTTLETLKIELESGLDALLLQSLHKEPHRRYSSVEQLSEDIKRFLKGQPIKAKPAFPPSHQPSDQQSTDTGGTKQKTLAVLPFKLLNIIANSGAHDTGDEFLGIGLADALITRLGNMRRFSVRPTGTVLQYANAEEDSLTIGKRLGVAYVLDGRILKVRDKIRVTVQLISIRDGASIWAEQFDENVADVLALQDSLSTKVAAALIPQISTEELEQIAFVGTKDEAAHEKYLRGRYCWHKFTEESLAKSIVYFYEAIALDPNYARAYSGVADYHTWLGIVGVLPPKECFGAARQAAEKAVELDPLLAEAHASLAFSKWAFNWDFAEGEKLFRHALELNPNYFQTHEWLALFYSSLGRYDEALNEINLAQRLNPISASIPIIASQILFKARRFEESLSQNNRAIQLEPSNSHVLQSYGWILPELDRAGEAVEFCRRAVELSERTPSTLAAYGYALARSGKHEEAGRVLREMLEARVHRYVSQFYAALVQAALGNKKDALRSLKQAEKDKDYRMFWLETDARFDSLRDEKEFQEIVGTLAKLKSVEPIVSHFTFEKAVEPTVADADPEGAIHKTAVTKRFGENFNRSGETSESETSGAPVLRQESVPLKEVRRSGFRWQPVAAALVVLLLLIVGGALGFSYYKYGTWTFSAPNTITTSTGEVQTFIPGKVVPLTSGSAVEKNPKLSPDKSRVLFVSNREGNSEIYVMNFDGSNLRRITNNKTEETSANWSPDGSRIVYESYSQIGVESDIWIMDADGSNQQNLTNFPGLDMRPIFSPDGSRIAFGSNRSLTDRREANIWVMNADGSNPKQLTDNTAFESDPNWSPDGKKIAYTKAMTGSVFDIWMMNADGSEQTNVSNTDKADEALPVFSPDGQRFVYSTNFESLSPRYDLWVMDTAGENRHRVTINPANDLEAVWLSDTKLVFQSNRETNYKIYQTDISDTEVPADKRPKAINSIAILPFNLVNLNPTDEHLSLGIAEAITSRLGQIKQLSVRPVTASSKKAASAEEAVNIGRELAANYVLYTQLERAGEGLQVTAALQNTEKSESVWSEKFSVHENELSQLQNLIVERVIQNLSLELSLNEREILSRKTTLNEEAYQFYLAGRYNLAKRKTENFKIALVNFEQAIALDPKFAQAYAGLADAYALMNLYPPAPPDGYRKARENAEKALSLDDQSADASATLGLVEFYGERRFAEAEKHLRRAIELNPSYAQARHWLALVLSAGGKSDEALRQIETAERLDPQSLFAVAAHGNILLYARQYALAAEQYRKILRRDAGFINAYMGLRRAHELQGEFDEAMSVLGQERIYHAGSNEFHLRLSLAETYAAGNKKAEAEKALAEAFALPDAAKLQKNSAYHISTIYALLGNAPETLKWLRVAEAEKRSEINFIGVSPFFDNVRDNSQFGEFRRRALPSN
ncbi:MAG: protein kinase, partial [Acidobacteriota bacterium]|nr:protein kinase [Acidobacteriota bacterium]